MVVVDEVKVATPFLLHPKRFEKLLNQPLVVSITFVKEVQQRMFLRMKYGTHHYAAKFQGSIVAKSTPLLRIPPGVDIDSITNLRTKQTAFLPRILDEQMLD